MEPIIAELIKLGLTAFFTEMKLKNKTDEEITQIFLEAKEKFEANDPSLLPDV